MCARWLTVLHHGIPTSQNLVECTQLLLLRNWITEGEPKMSRKLLYLSFKVNLTAILFVSALFVSAQTIWYCLLLLKTLVVFGNSVHQCGNKR